MGRWSKPRLGKVRHSQWGARDAGANEILGMNVAGCSEFPNGVVQYRINKWNKSQWNNGGAWERRGCSEFPD